MVKCVTVDLEVPASSHIVLEGYVNRASAGARATSAITPAIRSQTTTRCST